MGNSGINLRKISQAILQGVLLEVSTYPKPGLVTPLSNGSHSDMNMQLFLLSSAAIAPCFERCAEQGAQCTAAQLPHLLARIRPIGQDYEQALLAATRGVNTQRGILFSGSVLAAAAAYCSKQRDEINAEQLSATVRVMCHGLCAQDLQRLHQENTQTAGEILYVRHGVTGIRGEAEAGFPTVMQHGLPTFSALLHKGLSLRLSLVHTLLTLMAHCADSTVLWRGGQDALTQLQHETQAVLKLGGMLTPKGQQAITQLEEFCLARRLSPGGSADLLALTVAFYLICHNSTDELFFNALREDLS